MVQFLLTFVRHGETSYNNEGRLQGQMDIPLNEAGIKQSQIVAAYLKDVKFDRIYSSDLCRASRTAEEIVKKSQHAAPPVILDKRLRERSFGSFEGKLRSEYHKVRKGNVTGEESLFQVNERLGSFITDLCQAAENDFANFPAKYEFPSPRESPGNDDSNPTEKEKVNPDLLMSPPITEAEKVPNSDLKECFWDLGYPPSFRHPHILISCHGFLMRTLIAYLKDNYKCHVPGGAKKLMKKNPNTGLSGFVIETADGDIARSQGMFIYRADHLMLE